MILIVDDKPENIFSLQKILELNHFEVDSAQSGEEALKKILKNSYALIILDVQMPGMDGFEVAETISGYSKSKDVPIIFLSAVNTNKQFITQGYASGGIDYVTKPVDPDILLLKVKTFYRLYEQTNELNQIQNTLRAEIEFRKQAQAELKERVQELRSTLETIPQIAFTAKADGSIEFVNQHWFNFSDSETSFPESHPEDINIHDAWQNAVSEGQAINFEVRIKRIKDGEFCYHLLKASPVKEGNVTMRWVGTFTDIEDQKRAELRKDEFLSIASHELKTPLTSIKAYMQLLERSIEGEHENPFPESARYLQRTQMQLDKLQTLIVDLLDISKIESGKMVFNKKEFDFSQLIENTIDIARQTNPDYTIHFEPQHHIKVIGDDTRVEQVLINYLTNAIKYSPDNKNIVIRTCITPDNHIQVIVKDQGIGIPSDKLDSVFKKFYRVEENSNRFQGLGIGLYICSEIIRRHHGRYGVKSRSGRGSEFSFTLPIYQNLDLDNKEENTIDEINCH